MKKCQHKCKWKKTGSERYTFPSQYELQCESCGKIKWKEHNEKMPVKKLSVEEWETYKNKFISGN